ncbi:MAG: hypothetical protein SVK54_02065, partial [candidate division WOR-3 bacterium]|nr:hypothetical protein [candidate division WOR-3 bacterium]
MNIKGKFETGASIEGYFKKSSRINDNDYINIKVYDKHYETEFGNTDRLTESAFYSNNKIIAVKGKVFNDKHSLEGGFGTPEGTYHYQYIEGDNTQGPFQLDNIPVLSMTEKIYVVEDGVKEELMNGRDYTIDYRTGRITLNFILTDDNMLEAEYYSSSWTDLSRVDYVLGANSTAGLFTFGLNAGGVYFKEDSLTDSLSDYMNAEANAGFVYGDLININ